MFLLFYKHFTKSINYKVNSYIQSELFNELTIYY
jgi:hypothetical protein